MYSWRKQRSLDSFYRVWVRSLSLMLLLCFGLFVAFSTAIIFKRVDRTIISLLERSQAIAWTEYNQFFEEGTSTLTLLADQLEEGSLSGISAIPPFMRERSAFDLWFMSDQQGRVLSSSPTHARVLPENLAHLVEAVWRSGKAVTSTELISLESLSAFDPVLAHQAEVAGGGAPSPTYGAIFQIVAVPYRNGEKIVGAIAVAHLLNNDLSIAERVRAKIPDSFNTISHEGVRVAGNLSTPEIPSYIGRTQAADLRESVLRGERYYGRVDLTNTLDHLVVSDPLRDSTGRVIGAVTTGHPSQGLASLKKETALYIGLSALLCWVCVFAGSLLVAKQWALPIGNLATVAKRIYEAKVLRPEHVALVDAVPSSKIREIEYLRLSFARATSSICEKNQEILGYLEALKTERNNLQSLAEQLQDANATLEARVEEKTLELRNAMLDLVASSNLKSKLLANTSHELRTPLNAIIGFADMLTSGIYGDLTESQRSRVSIIGESARYLLNLINDLLDVSLVAQGKMTLDRQLIDMNELVASALTIVRADCEQHQIQVEANPGLNLPLLLVDPNRIKQVVYNVLSNAVKYTPEGGTIRLQTSIAAGEILLSVEDTGIGISEEDQLYIFDEFYQAENAGQRKQGGIGLGLPLSKRLVELHGGRMALRSRLGKGTRVTISLPIEHVDGEGSHPAG